MPYALFYVDLVCVDVFQLGLPLSCLCTVPCNVTHMDMNVLQKLVEDDASSGKTPTIIIAYAGNCVDLCCTATLEIICSLVFGVNIY